MDWPSLQETVSQESAIPLQQLEPLPVESPLNEKQTLDPPLAPFSNPLSMGLTFSGHGSVYYCKLSAIGMISPLNLFQ